MFASLTREVVKITKDRHGCLAHIVYDKAEDWWFWEMEDEQEGPFDSQETAEMDLASR